MRNAVARTVNPAGYIRDGNTFRRFRRDDRVNRGIQALTTMVSAM